MENKIGYFHFVLDSNPPMCERCDCDLEMENEDDLDSIQLKANIELGGLFCHDCANKLLFEHWGEKKYNEEMKKIKKGGV